MFDEEFENELSSDDSDFRPDKQQESVSENSEPDDDDPENSDNESGAKNTKRQKKASNRRKDAKQEINKAKIEKLTPMAPDREEENRRTEALWAEFLGGSETPAEPKKVETPARPSTSVTATVTSKPNIPLAKAPAEPSKIFEFAGETIEIPSKAIEEKSATKLPPAGVKRPSSGGGLSSVLNQLTKKNKLSVLEKTKLDWDGFKSNEGINEELQTHNRGRDG